LELMRFLGREGCSKVTEIGGPLRDNSTSLGRLLVGAVA
jgi:hypothetical protein